MGAGGGGGALVGDAGRAEVGIVGGGEGTEIAEGKLALERVGDLIGEWKLGSIGSGKINKCIMKLNRIVMKT